MEDEQSMRNYLSEGDLISAEVHSIFADGSLSLHMRSLKYGKVNSFNVSLNQN
jgi:exosome complex component RRP4